MKTLLSVVALSALLSPLLTQAQSADLGTEGRRVKQKFCTIPEIKQEARHFIWVESTQQARLIEKDGCLDQAIDQMLQRQRKARNLVTERNAVLDILSEIKHSETAAYMKCLSTDTPGCIDPDGEDSELDLDADRKRLNPLEGKDW